jgi:polo-like kinase 1
MQQQVQQPQKSSSRDTSKMQVPSIVEEKVKRSNGEQFVRKYTKGKLLGKGGFATCYEFTLQSTGEVYAAKVIDKATLQKDKTKAKLTTEIKIHSNLTHKHIVKFHRYFEDSRFVYILLEVCHCRSLMEMMKKMTRLQESAAAFLMYQILIAVQYMHENLVIHRDLKLGNLFLTDKMEVKIGDFGLAAQLDYPEQRKQTLCGTPNYIAPEILRSTGHSYEVDVWSIGVIFYTLLIGTPPFETSNVKETYKNIKENNYRFPSEPVVGELAKDLIKSILVPDPAKRPTVSQILAHKFFAVHHSSIQTCPSVLCDYAALYSSPSSVSSKVPQPVGTHGSSTTRVPFKPIQNIIEPVPVKAVPLKTVTSPVQVKQAQSVPLRRKSPLQRFQQPQPLAYRPLQVPSEPQAFVPRLSPNPIHHSNSPIESARTSGSPSEGQKRDAPLFNIQQYTSGTCSSGRSSSASSPGLTNEKPSPSTTDAIARSEDDDDHNNLTAMHENLTQSFVSLSRTAARERIIDRAGEPAPKRSRTPTSTSPSYGSSYSARSSSAPRISPPSNRMDIEEEEDADVILHDNVQSAMQQTSVWVTQWGDFTTKYGLAYRLNSGVTGAHFNDASKLIWDHETGRIDYIERKRSNGSSASFEERTLYTIEEYPSALQKKVTLIKHFRTYLDKDQAKKIKEEEQSSGYNHEKDVYVKRWLKTRHAIIFRLSNKVVQVHFHDGTEIILSSEARLVTYTDARGERKTFPLSTLVNNPQVDVSKRLKYTKDILYQLISKQNK